MVVSLEAFQESIQWAHTVGLRNTVGFVIKITLRPFEQVLNFTWIIC